MKRNILTIATTLLLATGLQAQCPTATLPWLETFANGLTCWYKPAGSNWQDVIPYNDPQYESMRYLYLQMQNDQQGSWIMSSGIQIPADPTTCPVLFWKVATNTTSRPHHYGVLVTTSSDYTNPANYTEIYTDCATHLNWSNYQQLSVSLAQFAGQIIHIAFHNYPNNAPAFDQCICIDDVEIRATNLPIVNLTTEGVAYLGQSFTATASLFEGSTTGLSFTWHSTLLDTTWTTTTGSISIFYPTVGTDSLSVIATNIYGSDTQTVVVSVITSCDNVYLPYVMDFESVAPTSYNATGNLPGCWTYEWDGTEVAYSPHVITTNGYSFSGLGNIPDNALLFQSGFQGSTFAEVRLPHFVVPLQHLTVALDSRFESATQGVLQVGYYDYSDFIPVQTIAHLTASYRRDTISFDTVTAPNALVAIRFSCNSWYGVIIDNIAVYSDTIIPLDSTVVIDTTIIVIDTTVVIDTVPPLPDTCVPSGLPWHETFADGDGCWYKPAGCKWHDAIPYDDPDYESQRYLYLNTGRDTVGSWIMSREIQIPADTNLQPRLSWRVSSSDHSYHHHYAVLVTESTYFGNPANYTVIYDDHTAHPNWSNWDTLSVSLAQYVGRNIHVAFHNYPDLTQSELNGLFIDDVEIFSDGTAVTDTVWRTVTVTANVEGACQPYGSGLYADSSMVAIGYTVIDTVAEGGHWQFLGWSDGGVGNPRNLFVTSDTAIVALFQWVADSVGISELRIPNSELTIFPNPTHGDVTVSVSEPTTLTVLDMTGRVVIPPTAITSTLRLPISDLTAGIYFVRVGEAVKKLVVQ